MILKRLMTNTSLLENTVIREPLEMFIVKAIQLFFDVPVPS